MWTTPDYSDVAAPTNFRITNATLTNGVYVLASHDDHPLALGILHPNRSPATGTGYNWLVVALGAFTRKWIDSDATCGTNCPWLLSCPSKGHRPHATSPTGTSPRPSTRSASGDWTQTIIQGAAAEITVKLPDGPPFVPEAPTNFSVTGGRYGSAATLKGEWHRNDSPRHKIPPAFVVAVEIRQPGIPHRTHRRPEPHKRMERTSHAGGRRKRPVESGLEQTQHLRHNFAENGLHPEPHDLDTEYTVRVGMCLTTACTLSDAVFATERTVRTPASALTATKVCLRAADRRLTDEHRQ